VINCCNVAVLRLFSNGEQGQGLVGVLC